MTLDTVDLSPSVAALRDLAAASGALRDATSHLGERVSPDEAEPLARLAKDVSDQLDRFANTFAGRTFPEGSA